MRVIPTKTKTLLAVTCGGQAVHIDFRRLFHDHIGNDAGRAARHGPPQRAVPGVQKQVVIARRPKHRGAVRGHRPQAGPTFSLADIPALGKHVRDHVTHRIGRVTAEFLVVADDLGLPCNADAVAQAGQ